MREIKFRAWHEEWKMMFDVLSIDFAGDSVYVQPLGDNSGIEEIGLDEVELIQYTGLKDCESTEIYDSDICVDSKDDVIQIIWSENHQWGCKIIKTQSTLSIGLIFPLWQWNYCIENGNRTLKVIGNIYENPELLEAAKDDKT